MWQVVMTIVLGAVGSLLAISLQKDLITTTLIGFGVILFVSLLIVIIDRYPKYFGIAHALAASVLVFRGNEILLVYNSRQHKWIPPGTHVRIGAQPHKAAIREVKEDSGYEIRFHEWHRREESIDRLVTQVPQPFYVQMEMQLPGEGHMIHYDLIYVGLVDNENPTQGRTNHKWVSLDNLTTEDTYPDVIRVAHLVYAELISQKPKTT